MLLAGILMLGFILRLLAIWPDNIIIGFDQARDLFAAAEILAGDIKIIGPTAGNNLDLHHGIAWLYYILPPLLLGGNPFWVSLWNSLFNLAGVGIIYLIANKLYGKRAALISAFLGAISYAFIQYAGWLSNPSPTIFTVPLFFWGLLTNLPLAALALGLSIQLELFFLYLIPVGVIVWFVLRHKLPTAKSLFVSLGTFVLATASMIATEFKFGFSGVRAILGAGSMVGGAERINFLEQFIQRFGQMFENTLTPGLGMGLVLAAVTVGFLVYKRQWFALTYLLSPATMLLLGYHNAPWFLIGLPPAIALGAGYMLSKIRSTWALLPVLGLIAFLNIDATTKAYGQGQPMLEPDKGAIMSRQLAAIDYIYTKAEGQEFAVNSVTNPLYINAVWAWHYKWYGQGEYGYLPGWLGGDQLPPYNTLPKSDGQEKLFFLIVDETPRIPYSHILEAKTWAEKRGKLLEEKSFDGILVQMYKLEK